MIEMSDISEASETGETGEASSPNVTTQLSGRFGPHPSVWTMYMSGYAAVMFSVLIALAFACGQWAMGHAPLALWVLPVSALATVVLYYLSQIAQDLSHDQMHELQDFIQHRLDELGDEDSHRS